MLSASAVPRSGYLPVVYLSGLNAKILAGVICGLATIPAITIPIAVRGERGGRALNVNRRGRDRDRCLNSSGGLRHANRDFPAAHVDGLLRRSAAFLSTFGYGLFILTLAALFAVGIVIDPARAAQKVPKLDIPQSFAPEQAARASTYELISSAALKAPPGAGKTTLLDAAAAAGMATSPEVARRILKAPGGMELRATDPLGFAQAMAEAHAHEFERHAGHPGPVLFDRGLPDVVGFLDVSGLAVPSAVDRVCRNLRYTGPILRAPAYD